MVEVGNVAEGCAGRFGHVTNFVLFTFHLFFVATGMERIINGYIELGRY